LCHGLGSLLCHCETTKRRVIARQKGGQASLHKSLVPKGRETALKTRAQGSKTEWDWDWNCYTQGELSIRMRVLSNCRPHTQKTRWLGGSSWF
jgi:hypothetical protein